MKLFIIIVLFLFAFNLSAKSISGEVVSIHDGDTITIKTKDSLKNSRVRLLGVDTPEIDFNGHSQGRAAIVARDYLREILPLNSTVKIELPVGSMDSNGRYLGQIFYAGVDINLEILKAGLGAVYFIYPYDKKMVSVYLKAAEEASLQRHGIFSAEFSSTLLPYMFRQETKGVLGNNIIADFETKKLYSAEAIEKVPHYRRVFFSDEETALLHGFNW